MEDINENIQYTCPMHSEIISNKADSCPKCGMDLVPMENEDADEKIYAVLVKKMTIEKHVLLKKK